MKHIYHHIGKLGCLLLFASALVGCVKEEELISGNIAEDQLIIVNALCSTGAEENNVMLHLTGSLEAQPLTSSELTLMVNGKEQEHYSSTTGEYTFHYPFEPGDKVQLTAKASGKSAEAEIEVPQPLEIIGVDTLHIRKNRSMGTNDFQNYVRLMIHVRQRENTPDMRYFRLVMQYDSKCFYVTNIQNNIALEIDSSTWVTNEYEYDFDPALSENMLSSDDDIGFNWFDTAENKYGLFRSNFFKNGEYTLYVDMYDTDYGFHNAGTERDYKIRIYSIPKIEYFYLNAIANLKYYDSATLLSNPPIAPSNVEGGAGIFSIASVAEKHVIERNITVHVGDYFVPDGADDSFIYQ